MSTTMYTHFSNYMVEIEYGIALRFNQDIILPNIFHEIDWEPLTLLSRNLYPHYVRMFYANIHSIVLGLAF